MTEHYFASQAALDSLEFQPAIDEHDNRDPYPANIDTEIKRMFLVARGMLALRPRDYDWRDTMLQRTSATRDTVLQRTAALMVCLRILYDYAMEIDEAVQCQYLARDGTRFKMYAIVSDVPDMHVMFIEVNEPHAPPAYVKLNVAELSMEHVIYVLLANDDGSNEYEYVFSVPDLPMLFTLVGEIHQARV